MTAQLSERTYRGESRSQREQIRKQKLLDATLEIFGQEGLQAVTVTAICERAGLTQRYFYESFANSTDIVIQTYTAQVQSIETAVIQTVNFSDPHTKIMRAVLTSFFEQIRENPNAGRIIFPNALNLNPSMRPAHKENRQRVVALIKHLMQPMLPKKLPRGINLDVIIEASWGAISTTATQWIYDDFSTPKNELVYNLEAILKAVGSQVLALPDFED